MGILFRLRRSSAAHVEEQGELNVIPYLDILMNLIIFMLLSMTGLATWGTINATAPALAKPGDGAAPPQQVQVSVLVSSADFAIATGDEVERLPGHDLVALRTRLVALKAEKPAVTKLFLAADADVPFETLVAVMDASRETLEHRPLFPDVSLAVAQ